ncbi:hypothetical protein [Leifsonia poae]|uniref:hypothetical protein n=1 Tax=Leifsonia poae TaxID=110933 RepID=UPI001CC112EB|nr:hypothetical protein [Leifsonia poae]
MTGPEMHPEVARAVRDELAAIGTKRSRLQRHQRRVRLLSISIAAVVVAGISTGAAIAANSFPGTTTVTPVGGVRSATHTGTGALELGPAPKGATRVIVTLRCLSAQGTISIKAVPQVASDPFEVATFYCTGGGRLDPQGRVHPWRMNDALLPAHGSTSITITADQGTEWTATGQYATSSMTPWATNAHGQTYGACNINGCPQLIGARATNGEDGFVFTKQFGTFEGTGYIPVYESDGTTVIGRFSIGIPEDEWK